MARKKERITSRPTGTPKESAVDITDLPLAEKEKVQQANAREGMIRKGLQEQAEKLAIQDKIIQEQITPEQKALAERVGKIGEVQPLPQPTTQPVGTQPTQTTQPTQQPGTGALDVAKRLAFGNMLETNVATGQPNIDPATGQPVESKLNIALPLVPIAAATAIPSLMSGAPAGTAPAVAATSKVASSFSTAKSLLAAVGIGGVGTLVRGHVKKVNLSLTESQSNMADAINAINAGGYGKPVEFWVGIYEQELANIEMNEESLRKMSRQPLAFVTGAADEYEKQIRWREGQQLLILNGRLQAAILQPDPSKVIIPEKDLNTGISLF